MNVGSDMLELIQICKGGSNAKDARVNDIRYILRTWLLCGRTIRDGAERDESGIGRSDKG